jgi:hypothetical protein
MRNKTYCGEKLVFGVVTLTQSTNQRSPKEKKLGSRSAIA